jgi:hypothetical protein
MGEGWTRIRMRGEEGGGGGVGVEVRWEEGEAGRKGGREEAMDQEGLMGYWDLKGCVPACVSERVLKSAGLGCR